MNTFAVNDYGFFFILINLFLLTIPFLLAYILYFLIKTKNRSYYTLIGGFFIFLIWLLFLPNTAYVILDIRHLNDACFIEKYQPCLENSYYLIFFFSYSIIGWIAFVYVLKQMRMVMKSILSEKKVNLLIYSLIPLVSLGAIMGLIDRLNSWEFFYKPLKIIRIAIGYFSDWEHFRILLIYTVCLYGLYILGDKIFIDYFNKDEHSISKNRKS